MDNCVHGKEEATNWNMKTNLYKNMHNIFVESCMSELLREEKRDLCCITWKMLN